MLLQARELLMRCRWKSSGSHQVTAWHFGKPAALSESKLLAYILEEPKLFDAFRPDLEIGGFQT